MKLTRDYNKKSGGEETMSKRSDVEKVLNGEIPEYVPWFGDLSYWLNYLHDTNQIPEKYKKMGTARSRELTSDIAGGLSEEGLQALHRDLGVGFYLQTGFPFRTIYHNVKVELEETDSVKVTRYHTSYGTLQEVWKYVQSTYSYAPVEYLIKTVEDMKVLKYIYENVEYEPDYELAELRKHTVGENGINVMFTPKSPIMELVALKAGIETVITELWSEEPEEFEELLECMKEKHTCAAQIAIDSPAEYIFVPDNLSSEMVGGNLYDDYMEEIHKDWTKRIRKAGKKSLVHLDGTLNPLLTKLSNSGFDVIEAVTPEPVGDVAVEDLRKYVREDTIIWGCMPSGFFSEDFPEDKFEDWTKRVLRIMKKDPRFVLGVADQVVPGTKFERIRKVEELVLQYGKFEMQATNR